MEIFALTKSDARYILILPAQRLIRGWWCRSELSRRRATDIRPTTSNRIRKKNRAAAGDQGQFSGSSRPASGDPDRVDNWFRLPAGQVVGVLPISLSRLLDERRLSAPLVVLQEAETTNLR